MSHALSALNRILIGVLGLAAAAAGLWALAWTFDLDIASRLNSYFDLSQLNAYTENSWYPVVMILIALLSFVVGLWLIAANLSRHTFNRETSGLSSESGQITISSNQVARSLANDLSAHEAVTSVDATTRVDRGRKTITMTVQADPAGDLPDLLRAIDRAELDLRTALSGMDLDTRYLLKVEPVASA